MMWKVLMVEDEPFVRRTLINQIRWREFGFELVGEAEDGNEAMAFIQSKQPDLVISDIVMPGMDGLELLRQAKLVSDAKFVMLTCVNEFEYARQALEFGASGYLLKLSADEQALGQMLEKIERELRQESERKRRHLHVQLNSYTEKLWSYIEDLVEERMLAPPVVPGELPQFAAVLSVLGDQVETPEAFVSADVDWLKISSCGHTSLIGWSDDADALSPVGLDPRYRQPVFPAEGLHEAWLHCLYALNAEWYGRTDERADRTEGEARYPWRTESELNRALELTEWDRGRALLKELWRQLEVNDVLFVHVVQAAERLDRKFARMLGRPALMESHSILSIPRHGELLVRLHHKLDNDIHTAVLRQEAVTDRDDINTIIAYIHRNLRENITLKSMAKLVNIDENYLSALFPKKTGETLINYVQKSRVEKAKKLLLETDLSLTDIYEQVGFVNENYFFRIFKRWTGETPGKFRKRDK
ncbi:helix-turn-helix domain-containing protein [Paenibacillus sp. V4I7]|uniref:response regulator transcription factor n=1 Tax=Paenibacillus sp. V4I7 TaxID=3042307 RepID=UPI0027829401|nr:helix-turn-helix domain-containing protein [Paenibacillus sp. V4I7]MDQ0899086.1 two-component system response regulator YesN [Paenibacillus sp. V4I7]